MYHLASTVYVHYMYFRPFLWTAGAVLDRADPAGGSNVQHDKFQTNQTKSCIFFENIGWQHLANLFMYS